MVLAEDGAARAEGVVTADGPCPKGWEPDKRSPNLTPEIEDFQSSRWKIAYNKDH
jgi:hypothetical protein